MEFLSYSEHIKLFLSQAQIVDRHLIEEKSVVLPLLLRDEDRKRKMNDELETLKKNLNRENMDKERIEKEIKDIQDVIEDYRKQTTNKDRNIFIEDK